MKKLLGIFALAALVAVPAAASHAATFAYVNTSGEVSSVEATTATTALSTAPNIAMHSGVMQLSDTNDSILNDNVGGSL
ncbi:MAG: hypothetical protein V4480_00980 [Patescibacteria group bacterium]